MAFARRYADYKKTWGATYRFQTAAGVLANDKVSIFLYFVSNKIESWSQTLWPRVKSKSVFAERSIWAALLLWIACVAAIIPLSHGVLPFHRPILEGISVRAQALLQFLSPVPPLLLMGVTYLLTI